MEIKACTLPSVDPDVFFPTTPAAFEQAKRICAGCSYADRCLPEALALGTSDGVWGGVLLERSQVVPVKRANGRPRKQPVAA